MLSQKIVFLLSGVVGRGILPVLPSISREIEVADRSTSKDPEEKSQKEISLWMAIQPP